MAFQQPLDLAEIEADRAQDLLDDAINCEANPGDLDHLTTQAALARHHYYETLNADLAL